MKYLSAAMLALFYLALCFWISVWLTQGNVTEPVLVIVAALTTPGMHYLWLEKYRWNSSTETEPQTSA